MKSQNKAKKIVLEFGIMKENENISTDSDYSKQAQLFEYNSNFLTYNKDVLKKTNCFADIRVTSDPDLKKEVGVLYFTLNNYFSIDESYLKFPFLSLITLGIYPMWSKIITDIRVSEYKEGLGEVEILKYSYSRHQVLSIFIAPIGLYRSLVTPRGLNANEADQFETNKYLMNEALSELEKKGFL